MVYFIQAVKSKLIKIGYTKNNPEKRLKILQTGSPEQLSIIGVIKGAGRITEQKLHEKFRQWRNHGEWYEPNYDLIPFIALACDKDSKVVGTNIVIWKDFTGKFYKRCLACLKHKYLHDFSLDNSRKDKLQEYCKECRLDKASYKRLQIAKHILKMLPAPGDKIMQALGEKYSHVELVRVFGALIKDSKQVKEVKGIYIQNNEVS